MTVVAVLYGGPSLEHDISVASGRQVLDHIDRGRFRPLDVYLRRDGAWLVDGTTHPGPLEGARALRDHDCEVVFLALHGPFGEDGTIQGFLDTIGIPYTASGHAASALARDKIRAKRLLAGWGVRGAPDLVVPPADIAAVREALGFPVVVKDPFQGSTLGLERARDEAELEGALARLSAGAAELLVEKLVVGREFTVPVLEDEQGAPVALPVVEIRAPGGFFDFRAKYSDGAGAAEEICPAPLPEALTRRLQEVGLTAHRRLGLRGMSRTDLILPPDEEPVFLETNSIPGFTARSLLPRAAAEAGIPFRDLITRLLEAAGRRAR